jgi:hypothetical protein
MVEVRAHPVFRAKSLWSRQGEGSREIRVSRSISIFRMAIDIIFESTNSVGHNHLQSRTPLSKWLPTSRISRVSSSSCPSNLPALADMSIQLSSCYSPERSTVPNHTERLDEQDLHIRESWVAAMKARIVRGELIKCQRGEGVNHYKHCRDLAEMYTGMIRENKVSSRRWISGMHKLGESGSIELVRVWGW